MSNFLNGFFNGFTFGMLRSTPMFGCFNYFNFMPFFNFFSYPIIPSIRNFSSVFDFSCFQSSPPVYTWQNNLPSLNQFMFDSAAGGFFGEQAIGFDSFSRNNNGNTKSFDLKTTQTSSPTFEFNFDKTNASNNASVTETVTEEKNNNAKNKTTSKRTSNIPYWYEMTDEQMRQIYGNYDTDVTQLYHGTADKLNKFLNAKGANFLKNKGDVFMRAQEKYGINALVLIAICGQESSYGKNGRNNAFFNIANMRGTNGKFKHFNNVDECIMDLARLLRQSYVDNPPEKPGAHLKKLYQICARYCPGNVDNNDCNWAAGVTACLKNIKSTVA